MARAIRFHETGGPEVLRVETVAVGEPGPGQARVLHHCVAVNFIDVYFRTGHYPLPLPNGLGSDAVADANVGHTGADGLDDGNRLDPQDFRSAGLVKANGTRHRWLSWFILR